MAPRTTGKDNTAAIAAQFGVSLKALRLYEQLGMLVAPRNSVGWRVYGDTEIVRLQAILTLKKLGLTVTRIAQLLKTSDSDLDGVLADQQAVLNDRRRQVLMALSLVRIARASLNKGSRLSPDELATLLERNATLMPITAEIETLTRKIFAPDEIAILHTERHSEEALLRVTEGFIRIHKELVALTDIGDPTSDAALDVARRADALIRLMANNDPVIMAKSTAFWAEAYKDPKTAAQLPLTKARWEFLHKALAEYRRRNPSGRA